MGVWAIVLALVALLHLAFKNFRDEAHNIAIDEARAKREAMKKALEIKKETAKKQEMSYVEAKKSYRDLVDAYNANKSDKK